MDCKAQSYLAVCIMLTDGLPYELAVAAMTVQKAVETAFELALQSLEAWADSDGIELN